MKKPTMIAALAAAAIATGCQTNSPEMADHDAQFEARAGDQSLMVQADASGADASGPQIGTELQDLPQAVRQAIQSRAGNAEIADIDKEERTGKTVYEVSFKDEGLNPKMHISEDGRLLSESETDLANNARVDADADISHEAAGAEIKVDADLSDTDASAEFNSESEDSLHRDGIRSEDEILVVPTVRGGAEALTQGPSADLDDRFAADAEVDADADLSGDATGVEIQADANTDTESRTEFRASESSISNEAAGAEVKAEADLAPEASVTTERTQTFESRSEIKADAPSAEVDARVDADADVSKDAAGVEIKADADTDLSDKEASAEIKTSEAEVSTEAAGAEVKAEAETDVAPETSATRDGAEAIEAKPEVRGGAEALTEGPSANLDAQAEADASVSTDSPSAELSTDANVSEAAGAESRSATITSAQPSVVKMNTLPQPVQNAIRTRGGDAEVSEISKKAIYEVKFANGHSSLLIREDGTIVEDKK